MRVQVWVVTMHQKDHSLLEKMNIQSDVIVGNQCNFNSVDEFDHNGHKAVCLNSTERGVERNRNNALMRANADICFLQMMTWCTKTAMLRSLCVHLKRIQRLMCLF